MISIIVPVYNAENFLRRCIDSILAQSYTDFELLLVDDGSTDGSGAICDEYAAEYSRVRVFHKPNGGVSSARNVGLDNARGEYITFCDVDDYVAGDWLETYREAIANDIDFIVQGFYRIADGDVSENVLAPFSGSTRAELQEMVKCLVTASCFGYIWVKAFCRELIEKYNIRFDENSSFTEDAQFIASYLEHVSSFLVVDKANYYYIAPDMQKKYRGDNYYSILRVCQSFKTLFDDHLPKEFCARYFNYIKNGAVQYILQGRRLETYHIALYKDMVNTLGHNKNLKDRLRNFLIIESPRLRSLSAWGLKLIRRIGRW